MRIGIIGVGGFAASHHQAIQALEATEQCQLVCTCDPDTAGLDAARGKWRLDERGVRTYAGYQEMLVAHGAELDIITVPTPIPLHAEMHRACVERGIACYLEKPPTLDPDELERMIAVDEKARKATQVGFNFIVENTRQSLKSRLLAGEFGPLRRVIFVGMWPRSTTYFTRNRWAGSLFWSDGRLVLDSCIGNAMAHYVHNLAFWAGTEGVLSFAGPKRVHAELYRARPIETFDTCFVRGESETGVEIRIASTHACIGAHSNYEQIECDGATIRYITGGEYTITDRAGVVIEQSETDRRPLLQENFKAYFAYVQGTSPRPLTRLTESRPFVQWNGLAYVAADAVTTVRAPYVDAVVTGEGTAKREEFFVIAGVRDACTAFAETGAFPLEQGIAWAIRRTGSATSEDIVRLPSVARAIRDAQ